MLTFEVDGPNVLEVNFDAQGREDLLAIIGRVLPGDHEHVSSPSWGGYAHQLTEDFPNPDCTPIHQVTFQWVERPSATE